MNNNPNSNYPPPPRNANGGGGTITISANNLGSLALASLQRFGRRHKVLSFSYLYGLTTLLLLLFLGSGTKLTLDQQRQYNRIMNTIDLTAEYNAASAYHMAYANYHHSKGWISCDAHCQHYKRIMDRKKLIWDEIKAEGNARMSDAKSVAGLFSEVGVGEVTDTFWEYFASGKQFAKRQSMWDAMFMGMRSMSRDESMVEYMLKMLMQVLINFSMGLVMALVVRTYLVSLPYFVCSVLPILTIRGTGIHLWSMENHSNIPTQSADRPLLLHYCHMCCVCLRYYLSTHFIWRCGWGGVWFRQIG